MESRDSSFVSEQIRQGNPWYNDSQFQWAEHPSIRPIYRKRHDFFAACLGRVKSRRGSHLKVLDAGCGDGYWLNWLRQFEGLDLTGVDYNPLRIERARQVVPEATLMVGDIQKLSSKGPFDVIFLNQVLEHVENDLELLKTVRTLLHEDGVFVLGVPNEGSYLQRPKNPNQPIPGTDHIHFYTESAIREKLAAAGFGVESVMREVFYVGHEGWFYRLTRRRWSFKILEMLTRLFPSGASDLYFECRVCG